MIGMTRRGQYHRRLSEELHLLAEATPESELAASALASVFLPETALGDALPLPGPLVWQHPLDPPQRQAVAAALQQPVTVVTGPPGTGKSTMVRHVLINQALAGRPSLFASRNHRALDAVEPAINALGQGETLIVRTSSHGQSRSWRLGLQDLLERDDADLVDEAASAAAFQASQEQVRALEAEFESLAALQQRYRTANAAWQQALQQAPAAWRPRLTTGEQPGPDREQVQQLRQRWQTLLQGSTWQRLLSPGVQARRRELQRQLSAWLQAWEEPAPAEPSPEHVEAWGLALQQLEQAAAVAEAWQSCQELEQRCRQLGVDQAGLLQRLVQAHGCCWQQGVAWLRDRAVAGPADPEARLRLANLRAGISSFGLSRWNAVYVDTFPDLLRNRPLWACSNLSAPSTLPRKAGLFDLLVVDEASQCDIPSIIPLLFRCRRVLAVGDPQQLGHISRLSALQDERLLASHGLLELGQQRFGYRSTSAYRFLRETPSVPAPILLSDHYRCHPQIASLFNRAFYRQRLRLCTDITALRAPARLGAGCHWHDVSAPLLLSTHGAAAPAEATMVAELLQQLEAEGYCGSIGVVTPFRRQVEQIRIRVKQVVSPAFAQATRLQISTAHGFQGDERDCLIFSLCGGERLALGAARFLLATPHLFNVAISRARAALHMVGNRSWAAATDLPFLQVLATGQAEEQDPIRSLSPESVVEQRLLDALAEAGIDALPQYAVAGRRIDLAVIQGQRRLAIEVDGASYHATARGARADDDHWRDLLLQQRGWHVLHFWACDVRDRLGDCVARVSACLQ